VQTFTILNDTVNEDGDDSGEIHAMKFSSKTIKQ